MLSTQILTVTAKNLIKNARKLKKEGYPQGLEKNMNDSG